MDQGRKVSQSPLISPHLSTFNKIEEVGAVGDHFMANKKYTVSNFIMQDNVYKKYLVLNK